MNTDIFPIKSNQEWSFEQINAVYGELERIAVNKYGLNVYPNQIEVVTSEQMLDAYAGHGMPIMYKHWSFGKSYIQNHNEYMAGHIGLAYEMVINSSPCINYLMEENSAMMQTLVLAHAAFGHNHFFANNYLFKQWTDAEAIIDYLMYANDFIQDCEHRYGIEEVEQVLDVAHAWQYHGIDKYKRPTPLNAERARLKEIQRSEHERLSYDYVMDRSVDALTAKPEQQKCDVTEEPQENILYFIEKHAPALPQWKREIIRIVRRMAQYFYPQIQTKVMNEGFATFIHYHLIHDLREEGLVDQGFMLEFYHSHTGVVAQPKMSRSINPYALGFAMFMDIKRVATEPTDEDRQWFGSQSWIGSGDWISAVKWAAANFKDESFIRQFLSPKVIRDFKLFVIEDDREVDHYTVTAIHDLKGYKDIREALANQYVWTSMFPDLQVVGCDLHGDRTLRINQVVQNGVAVDVQSVATTGLGLSQLWGYPVEIQCGDAVTTISPEGDGESFNVSVKYRC